MCYTIIKDKGYTNNTKENNTMTKLYYVVYEEYNPSAKVKTLSTRVMDGKMLAGYEEDWAFDVLYFEEI